MEILISIFNCMKSLLLFLIKLIYIYIYIHCKTLKIKSENGAQNARSKTSLSKEFSFPSCWRKERGHRELSIGFAQAPRSASRFDSFFIFYISFLFFSTYPTISCQNSLYGEGKRINKASRLRSLNMR